MSSDHIIAVDTYGSQRVTNPHTKRRVSAYKIGYNSAASDVLLQLFGAKARNVSPPRASYHYVQIDADVSVRHGYILLKLTADELAQAEQITRRHHRAATYLWQEGQWYAFPTSRANDYSLSTGTSGPNFNPSGIRVVSLSTGEKEAAITGIIVEKSQKSANQQPWWWLGGETYPHREILKRGGARFSAKRKQWYYIGWTLSPTLQQLVAEYGTPQNTPPQIGSLSVTSQDGDGNPTQVIDQSDSWTEHDFNFTPQGWSLAEAVSKHERGAEAENKDPSSIKQAAPITDKPFLPNTEATNGATPLSPNLNSENAANEFRPDPEETALIACVDGQHPPLFQADDKVYSRQDIERAEGQPIPTGVEGKIIICHGWDAPRSCYRYTVSFTDHGSLECDEDCLTPTKPPAGIRVMKKRVMPEAGAPLDNIQEAILSAQTLRGTWDTSAVTALSTHPTVTGQPRRKLALTQRAYVGELTGAVSGYTYCYGLGIHQGQLLYLDMGGPRSSVEAIRAKISKHEQINLIPQDGPAIELSIGEEDRYIDFTTNIPEAKFQHTILAHRMALEPVYGGKSLTFFIRTDDAQGKAKLKAHVFALVNIPVFDVWSHYLWEAGQKAMLVRRPRTLGGIDLWVVDLGVDAWTRLITGGVEQGIIPIGEPQ